MSGSTVVAVVGPTASGKSALAMALAPRIGGQIVNADSMQVYRGMDIGTAKPTVADREVVQHHLIDIWPVTHDCTVAEFQPLARDAIAEVHSQNSLPILTGGSGLYVRAVLDELEFPGTDQNVRVGLELELSVLGPAALHERLAKADPAAALAILPTNGRRIVRALEVIAITGKPFTATLPAENPIYPDIRIGLAVPSEILADRIEARVDQMWRDGFVDEVRGLTDLAATRTASRALGYSQIIRYLAGEIDEQAAREETVVATRQFAKRQLTWFRRDSRVTWLDYDDPAIVEKALELINA